MKAILDNRSALKDQLPAIAEKRMHNARLVQHMVGPDNEDRLVDGRQCFERHLDDVLAKKKAASVPGEVAVPDVESLLVSPDAREAAGEKTAQAKVPDTTVLRANRCSCSPTWAMTSTFTRPSSTRVASYSSKFRRGKSRTGRTGKRRSTP